MSLESSLRTKLKSIFGFDRATFNLEDPDATEQDKLFIELQTTNSSIKDGLEIHRVTGQAFVYGQSEKMPIGFFTKKIRNADPDDTKDLFFFNIEDNVRIYQNLIRRSFSFVYFFSTQYDPENGTLTSIDISEGDS